MKRNQIRKIFKNVFVMLLCICVLYIGGIRYAKEWNRQFYMGILKQAEKQYMSRMFYIQQGEKNSKEAIIKSAFQIMPLGEFVNEKTKECEEKEDVYTNELILAMQEADENEVDEEGKISAADEMKQATQKALEEAKETKTEFKELPMEKLKDFDYLTSHFYTIDCSTYVKPEDLQVEKLMNKNVKINRKKEGPKILLYHTHSQEAFKDSVPGDVNTTIVGMGRILAKLLNETYGIETLHHEGIYDMENGHVDRSKAYERARPHIQKILEENPSIEMVIDLHRDGVGANTHLVTNINGKQTAKIMFFNGLSRTRTNGNLKILGNPYIQDNLALSLQMKLAAERMYPGFARNIYLKGYRYNMHFKPKNMLIEGGAQTNTVEEMKNAMVILAEIINEVVG